jgi:hypothetical protein
MAETETVNGTIPTSVPDAVMEKDVVIFGRANDANSTTLPPNNGVITAKIVATLRTERVRDVTPQNLAASEINANATPKRTIRARINTTPNDRCITPSFYIFSLVTLYFFYFGII